MAMQRRWAALAVFTLMGAAVPALPAVSAPPTTFTVTEVADTVDGTCDADCSLRDAVIAANANRTSATEPVQDVIVLQNGATYALTITGASEDAAATGDLDITDDVIIRVAGGGTATIDATALQTDAGADPDNGDGDRVFHLLGVTALGIDGVTITGGDVSDTGGGIYATDDGVTLGLTNSTVEGNAAGSGGGLYADNNSVVTITGSVVDGNLGGSGGGIYGYYANISLTDSTVDGNEASSDAGGIYNDYGNVETSNTSVSDNTAASNGGAYYGNYANGVFADSTLDGNTAEYGGAVYNYEGQAHYARTSLDGNTAEDYGGTIYGEYGADVLIDSPITNSGLDNTSSMYGGAIYAEYGHNVDLTRSPISDTTNTTTSGGLEGGAIYVYEGRLSLTDSPISNTVSTGLTSTVDGGAIYLSYAGLLETGDNSITGTTVDTTSSVYGGVIYAEYGGFDYAGDEISDTTVTAGSSVYGGAVYLYEASANFDGMTFDNTMVDTDSTVEGGVISQDDYGEVTIRNSTVTNTTAGTGGNSGYGGVYYGDYGPVTIENSTFENNTTTYMGGAVSWYEAGVVVRNSVFRNNSVVNPDSPGDDTYGGAFGSYDYGSLLIENSLLEGNSATYEGGAIYGYDSPVVVRDSEIIGNSVDDRENGDSAYGGAISLYSSTPLIIERSVLAENVAVADSGAYGGALYAYDGPVTLRDTTFRDNAATSRTGSAYGGAVYFYDTYEAGRIEGSLFEGNTVDGDVDGFGGAFYVDQTNVVTQNATFTGNSASTDGGAAYVTGGGSFRAIHVTGVGNTTPAASGGFVYNDGSTVVLKGALLQDNAPDACAGDPNVSQGWNMVDDTSCVLDQASDQDDVDVAYDALSDNGGHTMTHALPSGSAAIDAAGQCTVVTGEMLLTTDQRGAGRPIDGDGNGSTLCDVGAYEYASGVTVVATDPAASEDGPDTGTFTFTRQGQSGDLTVYFTIGGTATNDTDYTEIVGEVTIPDGAASATVLVTPKADDLQEGSETVLVTLLPDTAYAVGAPDSATVTIADRAESTTQVGGVDRYDTAIQISGAGFGDGEADAVVLARADVFADALAGTPLAHARNAPMLITPTGELLPQVAAEIERVLDKGKTVYVLGGTAALAEPVVKAVNDLGYPTRRVYGADRYETAVAIARDLGSPSTVLVTTGMNFPDALAAGAAAANVDGAVLLTPSEARNAAVDAYLASVAGVTLYGVGGPAARPYSEATPVVGIDRFETATKVAEEFFDDPNAAGLARFDVFADALTGGPHIASQGGPMLLTPSDVLHPATSSYLCSEAASLQQVYGYGGTVALQPGVLAAAEDRIGGTGC